MIIDYASGFRGFGGSQHITIYVPPKNPNEVVKAIRFGEEIETTTNLGSNLAIMDLYAKFEGNVNALTDFSFRERVLVEALKAFGVKDYEANNHTENLFAYWAMSQSKGLYFSAMHKRFVLDTIRFITTGIRHMEPSQWLIVLKAEPISIKDKDYPYDLTPLEDLPSGIDSVLAKWVGHRGGFSDLLMTLNILFGERK